LSIGDLALAESEIFGDEGVATSKGFRDLSALRLPMRPGPGELYNRWPVDPALHAWARPLFEEQAQSRAAKLGSGPFVTVSTCTGTTADAIEIARRTGGICENMEGAAVALACRQMTVPLLEVRGISNQVEDYDPTRWDLPAGMTAAQNAVLALLPLWPGTRA
jgi:futalosine hydrolase